VLEYNARFGDPETQAILVRMKSDLVPILLAVIEGTLDKMEIEWDPRPAVCVVMASGGYPGAYEKGKEITGLDAVKGMEDVIVFHAGTAFKDGRVVTSGGRVLGVTALGEDIGWARLHAYEAVRKIKFQGVQFRTDIGAKALKRQLAQ
jgi:phosphoribosylamine--glycine ligase